MTNLNLLINCIIFVPNLKKKLASYPDMKIFLLVARQRDSSSVPEYNKRLFTGNEAGKKDTISLKH